MWRKTVDGRQRHYIATITVDLLDDVVVERRRGGVGQKGGRHQIDIADSYEEAQKILERITKRRKQREYEPV